MPRTRLVGLKGTAMGADNLLADEQAQPKPTGAAAFGAPMGLERVEECADKMGRNGAHILH